MNHSLFAELEAEVRREFAFRKERNRKLRNVGMLMSMGIVFALLGTGLTISLSLIPAAGWISIVVFFAAVFGLQRMIFKDPNRNASWFWWLLFTCVMSYFIAPMIGFVAWGAYGNEGLLVIILGLCGVLSWLFVTFYYVALTRLDFIRVRPNRDSIFSAGAIIFTLSWGLHIIPYSGMRLGSFYPLLASMEWVPIIIFCFAALLSLTLIKNPKGIAGLAWLLLFTFLAGYFIAPLTGIRTPDEAGLLFDLGAGAVVVILFSVYYLGGDVLGFDTACPHSKLNIANIGILSTLFCLIKVYNLSFY